MDTQYIRYRRAGVCRIKPQVRWAWVVALSLAVVGGAYERVARREASTRLPAGAGVSSAPGNAGFDDKRT